MINIRLTNNKENKAKIGHLMNDMILICDLIVSYVAVEIDANKIKSIHKTRTTYYRFKAG